MSHKISNEADKIAIIGIGCVFPGAKNLEEYWNLIIEGRDAITEIPQERWDIESLYDESKDTPGKMNSKFGGLIDKLDMFDANFFGISPVEAPKMDPQHRILLETTYHAFENANIATNSLAGSKTGVFVGISTSDYSNFQFNDINNVDAFAGLGNAHSIAANRISYTFDLHGPSMAIDTACSSSLVATHIACEQLITKSINLAIVGGVNALITPGLSVSFSKAGMLSPDGRCKTFDDRANGYVRGEGCGIIILKRLSDAIADKNKIFAIIKGSAVNQDGLSNGITAPNGVAQQEVIKTALENANIKPNEISYIETHGTGTSLGDPIEYNALKAALMKKRNNDEICFLGSVKANIGHLEAAAGIAGIIKTALVVYNKQIPPNIHVKSVNKHISLKNTTFRIPTDKVDWDTNKKIYAAVSSFGFGGTNAHAILEDYNQDQYNYDFFSLPAIITISAKDNNALKNQILEYKKYLDTKDSDEITDISYTSAIGRNHYQYRISAVGNNKTALLSKLDEYLNKKDFSAIAKRKNKIAFIFTGQGSQYIDMGKNLYYQNEVFRSYIDRCNDILQPILEKSIIAIMFDTNSEEINETQYTQPALFTIGYSLAKLWMHLGVEPDYVMGHSVGEYIAACISGVFNLNDALKLIAERGKLMQQLPQDGDMLAVFTGINNLEKILKPFDKEVSIAAYNGPESIVISGKKSCIEIINNKLIDQNIRTVKLNVSHAFHSPLMIPVIETFKNTGELVTFSPPKIKLVSNLTGNIANQEITTVDYWCKHILEAVRFEQSINFLTEQGANIFIEMGPKPTLSALAKAFINTPVNFISSLNPPQVDVKNFAEGISSLYNLGLDINWLNYYHSKHNKVDLPLYPFQQKRYWLNYKQLPGNSSNIQGNELIKSITNANVEQLANIIEHAGWINDNIKVNSLDISKILIQINENENRNRLLSESLYEIKWEQIDFKPNQLIKNKVSVPQTWIIFSDNETNILKLGDLLVKNNIIVVSRGNEYIEKERIVIESNNREHYLKLFRLAAGKYPSSIINCLYLWGIESPSLSAGESTIEIENTIQLSYFNLVTLSTSFASEVTKNRGQLISLTVQSSSLNGAINPLQSILTGIHKTLLVEYPDISARLIDLDIFDTNTIKIITDIILTNDNEHKFLSIRDNKAFIPKLSKAGVKTNPIEFHNNGSYLVTGGSGYIGTQLVKWLIENKAGHIYVVSRNGFSEETIKSFSKSELKKITIFNYDISEQENVIELFSKINDLFLPLKGIFHASGILDDSTLLTTSWEKFKRVLKPKLLGTLYLHEYSKNLSLDYFVSFSSIASVFGSNGQVSYTAANAFLDAFMQYRRSNNLPAISLNWGPWAGGMANKIRENGSRIVESSGIIPIQLNDGLNLLRNALQLNRPQIGIFSLNWEKVKSYYPDISFISRVAGIKETEYQPIVSDKPDIIRKIEAAGSAGAFIVLAQYLHLELVNILGIKEEQIDINQGFAEMGLNSLLAVELKNKIQSDLGITLSATAMFNFSNIKELAKCIHEKIETSFKIESVPVMQKAINYEFDINEISDEEARNILMEKIENILI